MKARVFGIVLLLVCLTGAVTCKADGGSQRTLREWTDFFLGDAKLSSLVALRGQPTTIRGSIYIFAGALANGSNEGGNLVVSVALALSIVANPRQSLPAWCSIGLAKVPHAVASTGHAVPSTPPSQCPSPYRRALRRFVPLASASLPFLPILLSAPRFAHRHYCRQPRRGAFARRNQGYRKPYRHH